MLKKKAATEPIQVLIQSYCALIEFPHTECQHGPGETDALTGFMDAEIPCLAFSGQVGLCLQQLFAGKRHETQTDGRAFHQQKSSTP